MVSTGLTENKESVTRMVLGLENNEPINNCCLISAVSRVLDEVKMRFATKKQKAKYPIAGVSYFGQWKG